jgi:phosphate transport system permease protein
MATDTGSDVIDSFGRVNKTAGTLFRYLLQAATLFGLVTLAILLVFVANDAIQPLGADPGWHLTFLLTLVVPSVAVGAFVYRRNVEALIFGVMVVGLLVVTLMFGAGGSMLLVDIFAPATFAGVFLAVLLPVAAVVGLERYRRQLPFLARFGAAILLFYLSLFGLPGLIGGLVGVSELPVVGAVPSVLELAPPLLEPVPGWLLAVGFLGLPIALAIGGYFRSVYGSEAARPAAIVAVVATVAGGLFAPLAGVDPLPGTVLAAIAVGPTGAYAVGGALGQPERREGLLVSAALIGGAFVGAAVVETVGFAGPPGWVDWQFLTSAHSRNAVDAGLYPAIGGSILLMITVAVLAFPVGVGAAVYLEEYAPDNRFARFIDVNISNLAGVPSVVYGLLGLGVFVTYLGRPTGTVAIGGATLGLLILPIVIISSREAIRSVPNEMRQASYGMGATKWQTVRKVVLPRAFPGILTGTILALGRAIGETAPLIMIGAPNVIFSLPTEFTAKASAMPLQVYAWSSLFAREDFYTKAVPAGVVVLISVLLAMNSVAIVLRNRYQSNQ